MKITQQIWLNSIMKSTMKQIPIYIVVHFALSQISMGMTHRDLQKKDKEKDHRPPYEEQDLLVDQMFYKFLDNGRDLFPDPVVDQALAEKGQIIPV